jgi:hypothetical protein
MRELQCTRFEVRNTTKNEAVVNSGDSTGFPSFGCFYDVRIVFGCYSMVQVGCGNSIQHLNDESKATVCVGGEVRSGEADQRTFATLYWRCRNANRWRLFKSHSAQPT